MDWHQISVVTNDLASESVAEALGVLGAVSVTFQDAADDPLYEPPPDEHPLWRQTRITALFENPADLGMIRRSLSADFPTIPLNHWHVEILQDRVWEREWIQYFKPTKFGDRLWVCPSHQRPPDPRAVNLLIDPGLAFGSGTHPTTALCLEWLSANDLVGRQVIDFGCGSGILAIAAVLLGAKSAVAVDIDPQALTSTAANARNNHVESRVHCRSPERAANETADIVLANILAKPLKELAPVLKKCVNPGGRLVISGLLHEQIDEIRKVYEPDFILSPPTIRDSWARLDGAKGL
jgi:ribosomal protein L11 methyltransferase